VMVDAEDLVLGEVLLKQVVQLAGGREIASERLFHHPGDPARRRPARAKPLDEDRHSRRRDGEVVDAVAARLELLVHLGKASAELVLLALVGVIGSDVTRPGGELLPDRGRKLVAAERPNGFLHMSDELLAALRRPRDAEDGEALGQELADGEGREGGGDLEVAETS